MIQLSLEEGCARKELGISQVSERDGVFLDLMRAEAKRLSDSRGSVTSDDIRVYASQLDLEPTHCNVYGAIFKGPYWKVIGRRKSAVPQGYSREIKIWQYVERTAT